jgi:hypothetical protein
MSAHCLEKIIHIERFALSFYYQAVSLHKPALSNVRLHPTDRIKHFVRKKGINQTLSCLSLYVEFETVSSYKPDI